MSRTGALRIAILSHSTNPRGGVVHALELAEALVVLGHEAVVHAPDPSGRGFFRSTRCETVSVMAKSQAFRNVADMVETRINDYAAHFENPANRRFDVFHAHDGISGNALANLYEGRLIHGFARTVHHIDDFTDARVAALQHRSIVSPQRHFVVSELWQGRLLSKYGIASEVVGNGVDLRRYTPRSDPRDANLRQRLGLGEGPIFLAIGGIEERKNTIRTLEAFKQVTCVHPQAQLVLAGGASILDHEWYNRSFRDVLAASQLRSSAVIETGPVSDGDMPSLYRLADALLFPSLHEGFGLVVLEAMASGVPVVTSRIAPFTEYLAEDDVIWCDPSSIGSIANSMLMVFEEPLHSRLIARGHAVSARYGWGGVAKRHLSSYAELQREIELA